MLGSEASGSPNDVVHVIQVALTPVFLLSGIASLLGVFAGRLARVADQVDALSDKIVDAAPAAKALLDVRLAYLRRRSHILDIAVVLGAMSGASTCSAALTLFIGTLRDHTVTSFLFAAFGMALLCTIGALAAFLVEMLMASRGLRDRVAGRVETTDAAEVPNDRPDDLAQDAAA